MTTRKGPTVATSKTRAADAPQSDEVESDATEEYRAAQEDEWGTYVATAAIDHSGVRAYNVGDPVPVSNVKAHGYADQGLVEKRS